MDSNNWLFGFSQNFISDLLILIIATVGGAVMIWAKGKEWRWTTPVQCGLLTGVSLYVLLHGLFDYSGRSEVIREHTWVTPCQLRMGEGERKKIWDFLQNHDLEQGKIKKIEIIVERGRKNDCLYAQDLKYVFDLVHWGPAVVVEETPPEKIVRGKAVWFENSVDDELARTFWKQTLCCLGQDFYHEDQTGVPLNTWMFFIRDSEGGTEPYSPKVMCPSKRPDQESLPQPKG